MKKIINKIFNKVIHIIKNCIHKDYSIFPTVDKNPQFFDYIDQDASDYLFSELDRNTPYMISRFGSVELDGICMNLAMYEKSFIKRWRNYFKDVNDYYKYDKDVFNALKRNAGFFNANEKSLNDFTKIYIESMKNIDVLGAWYYKEKYLRKYLPQEMKKIPLWYLEPWFFDKPAWTRILKGKKVLVIHPFEATIKKQYKIREKLFANPGILPEFELITIKAVQSLAGQKVPFDTWFDALEYMKSQIITKDFDIAIIGCGAYGMPLASFIKDLGKQAIHLGGQLKSYLE